MLDGNGFGGRENKKGDAYRSWTRPWLKIYGY
jgi:hypothetical protein